jgi:type-F conjugative transfer system secretin TraK
MKHPKTALLIGAFFMNPTFGMALTEVSIKDQGSSTLELSTKSLNRLMVENDRIKQIYGADDRITFDSDEGTGQVFIKLNEPLKDPMNLTLITENGLTHDLEIYGKSISGQVIRLKGIGTDPSILEKPKTLSQSFAEFISHYQSGGSPVGYNYTPLETLRKGPESIEVLAIGTYSNGSLIVDIYSVHNIGDEDISISEDQFKEIGDEVLSLNHLKLAANEETKLFVARRIKP